MIPSPRCSMRQGTSTFAALAARSAELKSCCVDSKEGDVTTILSQPPMFAVHSVLLMVQKSGSKSVDEGSRYPSIHIHVLYFPSGAGFLNHQQYEHL